MKKIGLVVLFSVLALGMAAAASPKISVDNAAHDFGEVIEGIAVVHTFVLTNDGDEPLTIDDVQVSCGCTTNIARQVHPRAGRISRPRGDLRLRRIQREDGEESLCGIERFEYFQFYLAAYRDGEALTALQHSCK